MLKIGNAKDVGQDRRGWFLGAFFPEEMINHQDDLELKWGIHPKGEVRESKATEGDAKTMSILIKGKYELNFGEEKIILENEGDYLFFTPNMPHHMLAHEDTVILTVRWPSLSVEKK
jgi:hypothetical protein